MADANEISVAATGATGALSQLETGRKKKIGSVSTFLSGKKNVFALLSTAGFDKISIKHRSIACSMYLMSPFAPVRSLVLPCLSIIKKKICLVHVSYGLYRRWACERTPIDLRNIPSHMPG